MGKISAGILLYKIDKGQLLFLLVHPGVPFFKNKDDGWWTIPKGEQQENEEPLETALREFEEETGYKPLAPYIPLKTITQKGGKKVHCWAAAGEFQPAPMVANTFAMEWPPHSGEQQNFPEVDQAAWFTLEKAKQKINGRQVPLLEELKLKLE